MVLIDLQHLSILVGGRPEVGERRLLTDLSNRVDVHGLFGREGSMERWISAGQTFKVRVSTTLSSFGLYRISALNEAATRKSKYNLLYYRLPSTAYPQQPAAPRRSPAP